MTKPLVADVMTTRPNVVAAHASLEEAHVVLSSTYITGLPVVDGDGLLVGVVTHADLAAYRFTDLGPQAKAPRRRSGSAKEDTLPPVDSDRRP